MPHEVVVADDASDDGSVDQLLRRFPQVRIVRHDERQGAAPAKALGAKHARGDVLIFLDGHMFMWGVEDLDFGLKCWLCHSYSRYPSVF